LIVGDELDDGDDVDGVVEGGEGVFRGELAN
jgi:hypothetical protein